MRKLKHYLAMALAIILIVFAIQNMATVELNFLFWSFQSRRFVVIAFALLTGFLIGMLVGAYKNPDIENKDKNTPS